MLGVIGYPVFLLGSILTMFNLINVTHGAGMLALVLGGLFELILPIWLFTKGFTSHGSQTSLSAPTATHYRVEAYVGFLTGLQSRSPNKSKRGWT